MGGTNGSSTYSPIELFLIRSEGTVGITRNHPEYLPTDRNCSRKVQYKLFHSFNTETTQQQTQQQYESLESIIGGINGCIA
jgi:hypothetical protein